MVTGRLTGGMAGIRADALTKVCMTVVAVLIVVMVDFLIGALARTLNDALPDIGVSADVDANMWVTVMPVFEFITLPISLEKIAFRCCSISAILCCRALQAWIPSYHVC